jgi:lysophospholipase L1-like esterase
MMTSKLILLALFVVSMLIMSFRFDKKKKILFFGDSITQQGMNAGGYIKRIDSIIKAEGLNEKYETIGAGISGNKVYDLYLRIEEDVLAKSPNIVVIYIGVNDVWHKASAGTGTDYDKFGKFYQAMVRKLQASNIRIILCTPAVIGEKTDFSNQQDGDLNQYSNWIRSFAAQNNLPLVDLRNIFHQYNLANNKDNVEKGILTVDRVHLNPKGNELVAEEMWKVIKEVR